MPSCLIELGFISTPDEERYLHSSNGVQQLGQGIYEAFLEYRRQQGKASAAPPQVVEPEETTAPQKSKDEEKKEGTTKKSRKKNKAAQDLADVLEGKPVQATTTAPVKEDADTLSADDEAPEVVPLEEQPKEPVTTKPTEKPAEKPVAKPDVAAKPAAKTSDRPVFKVQVLASSNRLKVSDAQLKGQKDVDCYMDGGMYKYTVGASEDYNAIYQLRKTLLSRFPQAFIIAFKDGKRMDVQEAIQEFKKGKKVK